MLVSEDISCVSLPLPRILKKFWCRARVGNVNFGIETYVRSGEHLNAVVNNGVARRLKSCQKFHMMQNTAVFVYIGSPLVTSDP